MTSTIYELAPWRPLSYPLLLPGTVLHELAHAAAALALGLGIEELVLFKPTTRPDGSVEFGWVTPRRTAHGRGAIMAIAPLLLVPPVLLAISLVAVNLPSALWGASVALWLAVGLGSLGAFPSPGDHVSLRGGLAIVGGCIVSGLALYTVGGDHALSVVLAGAVLALLIPAAVFVVVFGLRKAFIGEETEATAPMVIVIHHKPGGLPQPPRPQWPRPPGRRR